MSQKREYYIDEINKTVNLTFSFDQDIIDDIKNASYGSRWNPELEIWIIPVDAYSKPRIIRIVKSYRFKRVEKKLSKDVEVDYERSDVDYAYLKGLCDSKDFKYPPRKYQLECLGYSLDKGSVLNGDDVGLGKTFESIYYTEVTNSFPCLVVVPSSVKYNWAKKWAEVTKGKRDIAVIESKETKKRKNNWDADVVIINYDIIGKKAGTGATVKFEELVKIPWKMRIFDEAHFLKTKTSQRARAAKMICKPDGIIQFLTGTAVMSRPSELWNLLKLLKVDHYIAKDWYQYIRRYCGGYKGKFGWVTDGATNIIELNQRLRDTCYIRREKRDVLDEMPDVTKQVIQVPITNLRDISKAEENFIEYIREAEGEEAADRAMEAEHLVALGALRRLAIEGKLKAIEQYLKDWKTAGNPKLVVFGLHREPLEYLAEKFKCQIIAGGNTAKQKQKIVETFIENDDTFLFANMESAGTGVDGLQTVSSNMLIIELPWRPSDLTQTIGRLDRSGQENPVTITFMLNDDSIDAQMWSMLEDKERVAEAVNKGIDVKRNGSGLKAVIRKILKKSKK